MKILQIIIQDSTVLLFTENPTEDVENLKKYYLGAYDAPSNSFFGLPIGYAPPKLTKFTFLGFDYPCISLWFDNEDIPDFLTEFTPTTP